MPRPVRFIPEGGALVEITSRAIQGRFLFAPSDAFNDIALGVLGRAQRLHNVRLFGYVIASNHVHFLAWVDDAQQLAKFMGYFASNLAREVARLTRWTDKIWSRRYQAIVISNEEKAQAERLEYILSHGVKEDLVHRIVDWPGVHCIHSLLSGQPAAGTWFNRTREYEARNRGESFHERQFASPEAVTLEPLPAWAHLPQEKVTELIREMVERIEAQAAQRRAETRAVPLGPAAIKAQHPHHRPSKLKKSPAPLFHAATRRIRRELYDAYRFFLAAFRDASERLRSGDRNARFPSGCFPPALPFVSG
jgi:REP element-mobilizing transposase RayT